MDCANVTKILTPLSAKRYFPPPDEHALYKDNFATGNGELSKVIADIARREGNVFFILLRQLIRMKIIFLLPAK